MVVEEAVNYQGNYYLEAGLADCTAIIFQIQLQTQQLHFAELPTWLPSLYHGKFDPERKVHSLKGKGTLTDYITLLIDYKIQT